MAGIPTGLDFAAVMTIGAGQGADLALLAEALPEFETVLLAGMAGDTDEGD